MLAGGGKVLMRKRVPTLLVVMPRPELPPAPRSAKAEGGEQCAEYGVDEPLSREFPRRG